MIWCYLSNVLSRNIKIQKKLKKFYWYFCWNSNINCFKAWAASKVIALYKEALIPPTDLHKKILQKIPIMKLYYLCPANSTRPFLVASSTKIFSNFSSRILNGILTRDLAVLWTGHLPSKSMENFGGKTFLTHKNRWNYR